MGNLLSVFFKKSPWANRSYRSLKKSNCEQSALSTIYKRVMRGNYSRNSLKKSDLSDAIVIQWFAPKKLYFSPFFWQFFTTFPLFMPKSKSLLSLFAMSLFFKERWEQFALFHKRIAISLFCSQKTSDSLKKPKSEFPTVEKTEPSFTWPWDYVCIWYSQLWMAFSPEVTMYTNSETIWILSPKYCLYKYDFKFMKQ